MFSILKQCRIACLVHGKFGDWIKLEFEWSQNQANRLMLIASELGDYDDRHNLPTANKSAYALASAMSKEDEEANKNKHKKTGGEAPIFLQQGRRTAWRKQLNPSPGIESIIA